MRDERPAARWLVAAAVISLCLVPAQADAYCVAPDGMLTFWSKEFPDLRIPVWLNTSANYSVAHAGQTSQDVARLIIEVIARHNESVSAPKLYFAGFSSAPYDPLAQDPSIPEIELPAGINIMSMTCAEAAQQPICQGGAKACARFVARPKLGDVVSWNDPIGMVAVVPPNCDGANNDSLLMTGYVDASQLLLHEIGHTLGLYHSNQAQAECASKGLVHGGLDAGASSVMQTAVPYNFAAFRSWRRDDLSGIDHIYGSAVAPLEIAWWDDADYPDYPVDAAGTSVVGMSVSRSVAVSNRTPVGVQALVTTAPDGRVLHRLMNEAGDLAPALADAVVDPSLSGRTWAMPAVALGGDGIDDRLFVAWMADEEPDSSLMTLRSGVRSTNNLDWTFSNHPGDFRVNRLSAAYVPGPGVFIVTTLEAGTTEIQVVLFDLDGETMGSVINLEGVHAYGVGAPLCTGDRCLVPFSESAFGGPDFGVAEIQIDARTKALLLLSTEVLHTVNTHGALTLVDGGQALLGGTGERRFALGSYPGLVADGTEASANPNDGWPLGVGIWGSVNEPHPRIFHPRAVVCGNGIVQGTEACDDGNDVPDDGCDACALQADDDEEADDPAESGTGADETAGGETGGAGLLEGDGCECRASRPGGSRSGWSGWFALFGFLALRTRRSSGGRISARSRRPRPP